MGICPLSSDYITYTHPNTHPTQVEAHEKLTTKLPMQRLFLDNRPLHRPHTQATLRCSLLARPPASIDPAVDLCFPQPLLQ